MSGISDPGAQGRVVTVPDAAVDAACAAYSYGSDFPWSEMHSALTAALPYLVVERDAFWRGAAKEGQEHVARMVAILAERDADIARHIRVCEVTSEEGTTEIARLMAAFESLEKQYHAGLARRVEQDAEVEALKHDLALVMDAASEQATLATDLMAKLTARDAEIESLLEEVKAHRADHNPLLKAANEGAARIKALEEAILAAASAISGSPHSAGVSGQTIDACIRATTFRVQGSVLINLEVALERTP